MCKRTFMLLLCLILVFLCIPSCAFLESSAVRIGYLESEAYGPFARQTDAAAQTLSQLGYLEQYVFDARTDSHDVWTKICESQIHKNALFVKEAFYTLNLMSEDEKQKLLMRNDLDVLLVMGTAAGKWLAANADQISYDYMVYAVSDPISAGLTKSETERINKKSFAHIDTNRMGRQISMAYRVFGFTDIGVVYEDSAAAYSYSGIPQLLEQQALHGFNIHTLHVKEPTGEDPVDYERYYQELKQAYASLIGKIQVLYITTAMIEDHMLPWLLEDVHKAGIITVAETSESQVEMGALIHISLTDSEEEGDFAARTLDEYIKGTPIDRLNQVFEFTPKISINFDTARLIGAEIPVKVLLIADTIYPLK